MREFAFQLNIINVASLRLNICNGFYIIIVQLFVMIQWIWRNLMLFILFLCVNAVPTTCVYVHV